MLLHSGRVQKVGWSPPPLQVPDVLLEEVGGKPKGAEFSGKHGEQALRHLRPANRSSILIFCTFFTTLRFIFPGGVLIS